MVARSLETTYGSGLRRTEVSSWRMDSSKRPRESRAMANHPWPGAKLGLRSMTRRKLRSAAAQSWSWSHWISANAMAAGYFFEPLQWGDHSLILGVGYSGLEGGAAPEPATCILIGAGLLAGTCYW